MHDSDLPIFLIVSLPIILQPAIARTDDPRSSGGVSRREVGGALEDFFPSSELTPEPTLRGLRTALAKEWPGQTIELDVLFDGALAGANGSEFITVKKAAPATFATAAAAATAAASCCRRRPRRRRLHAHMPMPCACC